MRLVAGTPLDGVVATKLGTLHIDTTGAIDKVTPVGGTQTAATSLSFAVPLTFLLNVPPAQAVVQIIQQVEFGPIPTRSRS